MFRRMVMRSGTLIQVMLGVLLILLFAQGVQAAETYSFVKQWTGPGSLWGIAVDETHGWVYAANQKDGIIKKYDPSGVELLSWPAPNWGIAIDKEGFLYSDGPDSAGDSIYKWDLRVDSDPHLERKIVSNKLALLGARGLAVDADGNVYVAEWSTNQIQVYTKDGVFLRKWGSRGSKDGYFNGPEGVAVDSQNRWVYVTDHENNRVQKFTTEGKFLLKWGTKGSNRDGAFSGPEGIAVDSYGNVYVADASNFQVQKFTSSGVFITRWGTSTEFQSPSGIAVVLAGNNVYVGDFSKNLIEVFAPTGVVTADFTVDTSAPMTATFTDKSIGAYSYSWTFGDGGTSTIACPTHQFASIGPWTVKLTVTGPASNPITSEKTMEITVKPIPITVTADPQTKVYGDEDEVLTYQTEPPLPSGDSLTGTLERVSGENVGTYAITQGTLDSSKYAITYVGADFAITPKPITVTADSGQTKIFGVSDPESLTYTYTPDLIGTDAFSGRLSRAEGENAGTYAITQGDLDLGFNYDITFVGADFIITPVPIEVTADAISKGFGATDPDLTYTITSGELLPSDELGIQLIREPGEDLGIYAITQDTSVPTNPNYDITFIGANFVILGAADFTWDATEGVTVKFTDQSTGNPTSWLWDFDDGTTVTDQNPVHTYAERNCNYMVTLTANYEGGSVSVTKKVAVLRTDLALARQTVPSPSIEETNTFVLEPVCGGTIIELNGGKDPIEVPEGSCGWIGTNHPKHANGDVPTIYNYIMDSDTGPQLVRLGTYDSLPKDLPTDSEDPYGMTEDGKMGVESYGPANGVFSVEASSGGGLGYLALVPSCKTGACTNNYALLIDGGKSATDNHIRYWNDISFMYQTLTQVYGYDPAKIIVLMSDGTSSDVDRHYDTVSAVAKTDSSPTDLNGDGSTDVNSKSATKENITSILTTQYTGRTSADSLFIFTTGHGGLNPAGGTDNVIYYTWNNGYITDTDFVNSLPSTFGSITMAMEQCYSGGFKDNFITNYAGTQKRIIATAASGSEPSYGNGWSNTYIRSLAKITDSWAITSTAAAEADASPYGNSNGFISMKEASTFATATDPAATSTLTYHEHPQYATKNYLDDGATKYLYAGTCNTINSLRVELPSQNEVWWTGGTTTNPFTRTIMWNEIGIDSHTVSIKLYNNTGATNKTLTSTPLASSKQWTWSMPPGSLTAGTMVYKIYITDITSTSPLVDDGSDRFFTIKTGGVLSSIAVSSTPTGATIYLDGVQKGTTPATLSNIVPGTHTVTLTLKDYLDEAKGFELPSNYPSYPVSFTLDQAILNNKNAVDDTGKMVITSNAYGAEVWIDDTLAGTTPYETEIIPGTDWNYNYPHVYKVKVKALNYEPVDGIEKDVTVGRGWTVREDFELTPSPWLLTFDGFFDPIKMSEINEYNTRKVSTIPIKWHLSDPYGTNVSDPASYESIMSYPVNCNTRERLPGSEVVEKTDTIRYVGDGNWHINMQIDPAYAGFCRNIYAKFYHDQKSPDVTFRFR
jgi:PKD repeat protein